MCVRRFVASGQEGQATLEMCWWVCRRELGRHEAQDDKPSTGVANLAEAHAAKAKAGVAFLLDLPWVNERDDSDGRHRAKQEAGDGQGIGDEARRQRFAFVPKQGAHPGTGEGMAGELGALVAHDEQGVGVVRHQDQRATWWCKLAGANSSA